jgi:ABC-type multidrug transport system fused ATPase/permease subunit
MSVGQSWFLKSWGEAYGTSSSSSSSFSTMLFSGQTYSEFFIRPATFNLTNPFAGYPNPGEDPRPWILTFFYINLAINLVFMFFRFWEVLIMYAASKTLFSQVMIRVSQATFRYYDITPIGRLLNRLTSDMGTVDGNIINRLERLFFDAMQWTVCVVVISSVTPVFLAFTVVLLSAFVYIFLMFLPLSQSLRRLETVSLSPLFANFGELLQGLTTVRAFNVQNNFQNRVISTVDNFQRHDHFYWFVISSYPSHVDG